MATRSSHAPTPASHSWRADASIHGRSAGELVRVETALPGRKETRSSRRMAELQAKRPSEKAVPRTTSGAHFDPVFARSFARCRFRSACELGQAGDTTEGHVDSRHCDRRVAICSCSGSLILACQRTAHGANVGRCGAPQLHGTRRSSQQHRSTAWRIAGNVSLVADCPHRVPRAIGSHERSQLRPSSDDPSGAAMSPSLSQ